MTKEIKINCEGAELVELSDIKETQGQLKTVSKVNEKKLTKIFELDGFAYPLAIATVAGKPYGLIDGHQRYKVLRSLVEEKGYKIIDGNGKETKKIPVTITKCRNVKHAKKLTLDAVSQFGKLNKKGLSEFLVDSDIDLGGLSLPDFNLIEYDFECNETEEESFDNAPININGMMPDAKQDVRGKELFEMPVYDENMLLDPPDNISTWAGKDKSDIANHYLYNQGTDSTKGLDFSKTLMAFYTADSRWQETVMGEKAGEYIAKLLNLKVIGCVAPDFSAYWEHSQFIRLHAIYMQRWVARVWQNCGLKVMPSFQLSPQDKDFCLYGMPKNAPCIALQWQARTKRSKEVELWKGDFRKTKQELVEWAINELKPKKILLYATFNGIKAYDEIPNIPETIYLNSRVDLRNKRKKLHN